MLLWTLILTLLLLLLQTGKSLSYNGKGLGNRVSNSSLVSSNSASIQAQAAAAAMIHPYMNARLQGIQASTACMNVNPYLRYNPAFAAAAAAAINPYAAYPPPSVNSVSPINLISVWCLSSYHCSLIEQMLYCDDSHCSMAYKLFFVLIAVVKCFKFFIHETYFCNRWQCVYRFCWIVIMLEKTTISVLMFFCLTRFWVLRFVL